MDELVKDAGELAITDQDTQSLKTLERSYGLRKAAKLKKVEINGCDHMEELWFSVEILLYEQIHK